MGVIHVNGCHEIILIKPVFKKIRGEKKMAALCCFIFFPGDMPSGHVNKNGKIVRNRESEDRYCDTAYTSGSDHEGTGRPSSDPTRYDILFYLKESAFIRFFFLR